MSQEKELLDAIGLYTKKYQLTPKEALASMLGYAQYHNKFDNIFGIYKKRFQEHDVLEKRHKELEAILALV